MDKKKKSKKKNPVLLAPPKPPEIVNIYGPGPWKWGKLFFDVGHVAFAPRCVIKGFNIPERWDLVVNSTRYKKLKKK